MMKIIVNCGPCREFIAKCVASIVSQTFTDWQAYVTVDPYGDGTFEEAMLARRDDSRIDILQNRKRLFAMLNLKHAIERSEAHPDDIIVVLDGDDWFATPDALRIIHDAYRRPECWMTYGSWIADQQDIEPDRRGMWPAYPENTTDFRHADWLGTAVRTWKRWLWDLIDENDFLDRDGNYFRVTEDQAVMLPMLEMSGTARARHIAEPLMVYNRSSPHACGLTRCEEMLANGRYIRTLPLYPRLRERPAPAGLSRHLASRGNHPSRTNPPAHRQSPQP
jgi:glycosyltransferase involved in cell wall biosynthesis